MTRRDQVLRSWIEKAGPRGNWQACISHRGKLHRKSTHTRIRRAALEFNLLHLSEVLRNTTRLNPQRDPSNPSDQSDLFQSPISNHQS